MGVYHLMGLGLSPGAVTGPISYLAHRYQRGNKEDLEFFARSGEADQKPEEKGDIQGIVIFTTKEVLEGSDTQYDLYYVENPSGRVPRNPKQDLYLPMQTKLKELLKKDWSNIRGKEHKRKEGDIFWCEVDLRNTELTYDRIIKVVATLDNPGKRGKEVWINLTGGNNVINFALQLAATLSSAIARLYYVQAINEDAEKCVRFTAENDYWVDLPVIPLVLSPLIEAVIKIVDNQELHYTDIYSRLRDRGSQWELLGQVPDAEEFNQRYLLPMWKPGIIQTVKKNVYTVGSQWKLIQEYKEKFEEAKNTGLNIDDLAKDAKEQWINKEEINLS
ncbi:hypothetical protein [Microcoleus sp. F4-D5]|uniref:hypothetical protein n=1 Tax=Microcoleus sp. F4-D5 TaxID=2818760 RepID=UPI002FCF66AD